MIAWECGYMFCKKLLTVGNKRYRCGSTTRCDKTITPDIKVRKTQLKGNPRWNCDSPSFLDGDVFWTAEAVRVAYRHVDRSKGHEGVTESKILGEARRGRNVGRRKSGDVPFPCFGGTDRSSTGISRSLRSCGIRKEDDSGQHL